MLEKTNYEGKLPELLICEDGTVVNDKNTWINKRRPEILEMFRKEEYGRMPDLSDVEVNIRVADSRQSDEVMQGRVIRKTIEITAIRNGIHFSFPVILFIPISDKSVPCFLTLCISGIKDSDPARHFISPYWPAETIVNRGYACAAVLTHDIAPDYDEGFTTGFHKLFPEYAYNTNNRPNDMYGTLAAWAWGASRIMDYFEQDPLIDDKRVAIVGHSRGGKTALWGAAQDERFAMAVSSSAGNSGDALSRGSRGERIKDIVTRFPYWFCKNYQKYSDNEDALPFDQHMLLSLIAPRLVYTSAKTFDKWADPIGQFQSCVEASPVYKLFGKTGMPKDIQPLPENPIHDGEIGHHLKTGEHDMDEYDWNCYMDFADKHL